MNTIEPQTVARLSTEEGKGAYRFRSLAEKKRLRIEYNALKRTFKKPHSVLNPNKHEHLRITAVMLLRMECVESLSKGGKLFEKKKKALIDYPSLDMVRTISALETGWFSPVEIEKIYFELARLDSDCVPRDYLVGEFSWAVHAFERPIHFFVSYLATLLVAETEFGGKTWYQCNTWRFFLGLKDQTAFTVIIRHAIEHMLEEKFMIELVVLGFVDGSKWQARIVQQERIRARTHGKGVFDSALARLWAGSSMIQSRFTIRVHKRRPPSQ